MRHVDALYLKNINLLEKPSGSKPSGLQDTKSELTNLVVKKHGEWTESAVLHIRKSSFQIGHGMQIYNGTNLNDVKMMKNAAKAKFDVTFGDIFLIFINFLGK